MTRTFVTMEISAEAYDEIGTKLKEAGYEHALISKYNQSFYVLDMHGIGLVRLDAKKPQLPPLTDAMYHAVRGLELECWQDGTYRLSTINDDALDYIWEAINTALRVQAPLLCQSCGKTMAEHDRMAHCPPK